MTNKDYLLLKLSVLEQVSGNEACRISEDILTIICDPAPTPLPSRNPNESPTPTPTVTPTITPSASMSLLYDNTLVLAGINTSISSSSSNGITFVGYGGSALSYNNTNTLSSATNSILYIRLGDENNYTEFGNILFLDSYIGSSFKIYLNNKYYYGIFQNGYVYFQG